MSAVSSGGSSITLSRGAGADDVEPLEPVGGGRRRRARRPLPPPGAGRRRGRACPRASPPRGTTDTSLRAIGELAGLGRGGSLRVAEVVQSIDQLLLGERLPACAARSGARRRAASHAPLAVQAFVDQPGEDDVVVAKERRRGRWRGSPGPRRGSGASGGAAGDGAPRSSRAGGTLLDHGDMNREPRIDNAGARDRRTAAFREAFVAQGVRPAWQALDRDHPVLPEIERQIGVEALDERGAVPVQEVHEGRRCAPAGGRRETPAPGSASIAAAAFRRGAWPRG